VNGLEAIEPVRELIRTTTCSATSQNLACTLLGSAHMSYSQRIVTAVAALVVCSAAACGSQTTEQAPTSTGPVTSSSTAKPTAPAAPAAPPQRTAPAAPGGSPTSTVPMMPNPNGDGSMVPCEGTICTNPNHGAGDNPADNGGAVMPNPNGDGSSVPCEGTICTNPNHGAGDDGNG
jgi:hypothetical protein